MNTRMIKFRIGGATLVLGTLASGALLLTGSATANAAPATPTISSPAAMTAASAMCKSSCD